jgi:DNA polymerase-3 subunit gamma/tau
MSSSVLYRKYRPSNFKALVGQDEIKNILIRSIQDSKFSQGYLFCGPRGTGKTTTARLVAKSLNCLKFNDLGDVCNECENCQLINNSEATDIVEMDGASNRSIDDIRNLKESLNFLPNLLKYKIFIIDEAHMLTKEAFNALLKTLEEPPSHVIFILATTESHKVPATILSRVVRFDFKLADEKTLVDKLDNIARNEGAEIDKNVLRNIYKFSGGSFRDAESLLSKLISSGVEVDQNLVNSILGIIEEEVLLEMISYIKLGKVSNLIENIDELLLKGKEPQRILEQILDILANNFTDKSNIIIAQELANMSTLISRSARPDLLLKTKLASLANNSRGTNEQTLSIQATKQPIVEKKEKEVKENINNSQPQFNIENIVNEIEKKDARLGAIMKDSRVEFNKNVVNIYNKYKFNLSYIQRKDILQMIRGVFEESLNLKDLTFNIEHDNIVNTANSQETDQNIDKSKESDDINKVEQGNSVIKSNGDMGQVKTSEVDNRNTLKDNSSLVENIL